MGGKESSICRLARTCPCRQQHDLLGTRAMWASKHWQSKQFGKASQLTTRRYWVWGYSDHDNVLMLPTLIQDQVYLFVGVWGRRRSFARRFCLAFGRKHKRSKERNTGGANSAATNTGTFTIFIDGQKQTLESVLNGYYTIDCTNNFFRTVLLKQSSFIKSNIPINDFQSF